MLLPAELVQCELCRTCSRPQKELQVIPFPTLYHQISGGLSHSQDMICKQWRISVTSGCWGLCDTPLFTARIKTLCSSQHLGARCKAGQGGSPVEDTVSWNFPAYFPFVGKTWGHSGQVLPHINRAEPQAHRHGTMHLGHDSHHPGNVMEPFRFIVPFLLSTAEPRATCGPAQLGSPGLPHLGDGCVTSSKHRVPASPNLLECSTTQNQLVSGTLLWLSEPSSDFFFLLLADLAFCNREVSILTFKY